MLADDGLVRPVAVKIGLSDGMETEITGGELKPERGGRQRRAPSQTDFVSSFISKVTERRNSGKEGGQEKSGPGPVCAKHPKGRCAANGTCPPVPAPVNDELQEPASSSIAMPLIELQHIDKTYRLGDVDLPVLKDVSLTIERGEFVALMGASGSGKTTLMNLLGCLDRPTAGSYRFDGVEVDAAPPAQLAQLRSSRIGFVFQSFNLLPARHGLGQRAHADGLLGREDARIAACSSGARSCWPWSAWRLAWTTRRPSCPAASNSAWPSPGRW